MPLQLDNYLEWKLLFQGTAHIIHFGMFNLIVQHTCRVSTVGAGSLTVIFSSTNSACCITFSSVKDSSNWFGNSWEEALGVGALVPPT